MCRKKIIATGLTPDMPHPRGMFIGFSDGIKKQLKKMEAEGYFVERNGRLEHPLRERWGGWVFKRNLTLTYTTPRGYGYEIDLEDVTDAAQCLDWIFQIRKKTWATKECIADLVRAFRDLFDPQANLCSFGKNSTIDPVSVLTKHGYGPTATNAAALLELSDHPGSVLVADLATER